MRDWILRLLAVLSAGVVLLAPALPAVAADDLGLPAWYGGAVKAFDRMGTTETEKPWWISKGTARKILLIKDDATVSIDATLTDGKRDGYPSQSDFDKALDGHAATITYKDTTFDVRAWLNLLGQTFADAYAESSSGGRVYGDKGYIPTAEEIDTETLKLAHTSSYLLEQAEKTDDDTVQAAQSACKAFGTVVNAVDVAWDKDMDTPGTYLAAAERDPEYGDVITYDDKILQRFDAMALLDRDNGTLYYDQIQNELEGKNKSLVNYDDLKPSAVVGGRKAQAKQFFGKAKTKVKEGAKQGLIDIVNNFVGGLIQDGTTKLVDMTIGLDNWCGTINSMRYDHDSKWFSKAIGYFGNKTVGGAMNIDCDDYRELGAAASEKQWKNIKSKQQEDDHETQLGSWKWHWSPWYVATASDGMTCYLRVKVYENADGLSFIDVAGGEVSAPTMTNALVRPDFDSFTQQSSMHPDLIGPVLPRQADAKGQVWDGTSFMTVNSDSAIGLQCGLSRKGYDCAYKYTSQLSYASDVEYRPYQFAWSVNSSTFRNFSSFASIVPGSLDWVMAHMRFHWGNNDEKEYDWSLNNMKRTLTDSSWSGSTIARESYPFTACGDDCPAAYQPTVKDQDVTTTTTVTDDDGTTHVSSLGGQKSSDSSGLLPRHVQAGLKDDGTIGGTLSFSASTAGGKSDLGTASLDGIYPNIAGKRLDLIDLKTGKSCFSEGYACADWVKETQQIVPDHQLTVDFKGTTKEYPALTYKCSYDVPGKITEVPLGECIVYAPQFEQEAQKSGQTTGRPDGSTSTNTTAEPDTGYSWSDCVKSATSETAAAWLYSPVTCAAHQLFIPDEKIMTTTASKFQRDTSDGISAQFRDLQTNWGALFQDFSDHGCHGVFVSFNWADIPILQDAEVLNACPGSDLEFLPVLSKAAITIALAVMAFSICRKAVMAIFDFHVSSDGGDA